MCHRLKLVAAAMNQGSQHLLLTTNHRYFPQPLRMLQEATRSTIHISNKGIMCIQPFNLDISVVGMTGVDKEKIH